MDFTTTVRYCEHMEIEGFGQRLRRVREELGIGLRELHRRSGIGLSTLQQWESGKRWAGKAPPGDDIKRIEIALGVPIGSLLATTEEAEAMSVRPRTVAPIRRLTEAELFERFGIKPYDQPLSVDGLALSAGAGAGVPQGIDDTLPRKVPGRRYLWEAPVVGDCMEDEIHPGEVVIYSTRLGAELNKIMVALRDEEELLIKRLVVHNGAQILRPNRGEDVPVDERIRFLGRGVSVQRPLL